MASEAATRQGDDVEGARAHRAAELACAPTIPLSTTLQAALPAGSQIALCWHDPDAACWTCACADDAPELLSRARQLLDTTAEGSRDCAGDGLAGNGFGFGDVDPGPGYLDIAWTTSAGAHAAIVIKLVQPWPVWSARAWLAMARPLLQAHQVAARSQARAEALAKSERLQQALYEIADLAGADLEMSEMLQRVHAVVAGLMYAENFYIVLYDDQRDALRFLYFADRMDPYVAQPEQEIPAHELPNSLTLALLRRGEPAQGSSDQVRLQLGVEVDRNHGPDSQDWLGVPMRRDDRVCGAIVVQSYDRPDSYGDEDRALLVFVAQHILTALDRYQAREVLEKRVEERTQALQQSNRDLQGEIIERQRAERLQRALFRIAELSITSDTLERFYAQVHDVVGELLYARNFYIALLTDDRQRLEFPYSVDERDARRETRQLGAGMTEYVIATGRAVLVDRHGIDLLQAGGRVHSHGPQARYWLGVPLFRDDAVVGVIAVQSYSAAITFGAGDQDLLTFVAHHISIGLARKQAQDRLLSAHAELEQRVDSRTRELALANAELLEQIGERLSAEQQLTHQTRHDALTGLPNRQELLVRLAAVIESARLDLRRMFAVLFLDLDRFKLINDSVGHAVGDELLVEVGRRIVAAVRDSDTVARLGGDEFAILIDQTDGPDAATELAQRILAALGQPCWIAGREVFPAASLGIAMWHPRYASGAELLRDADAAMYRAKASGRDRFAVFDEDMRVQAVRILDLEADLRRAINGTGFVAFYQPIMRLSDRKVIGHEALVRWRHEQRGLLLPAEFIGLGEDKGLIEEVDWLVYAQVIERLARGDDGYISINVSPRHFRMSDFADRLLRMTDRAGADPHRLRIEITEVSLLDDIPAAVRLLRTLRNEGVLAQIDDFGTGYSALSYLHRFPIECLKIDQSFVAGLTGANRAEAVAVIRAIQALAGTLGIHTIGEGIEDESQCRALFELGCGYGQGYLLGRPAVELVGVRSPALVD